MDIVKSKTGSKCGHQGFLFTNAEVILWLMIQNCLNYFIHSIKRGRKEKQKEQ